jgi:flagellar L-ring protein precursor FlgH
MSVRALLIAAALIAAALPATAESLYREGTFRPLTADQKAFRPGDVITVQVFENASATTSADTGTRRKNNVEAELSHRAGTVARTAIGMNGEFDGGGRTQRSNRVLITLSVSVTEVLPNGDLRIAGDSLLTVNNELQKVSLEGRVRPQDVSDGNVVLSSRVADAKISYHGEGEVSDRQQRPWWRKLLDWAGV